METRIAAAANPNLIDTCILLSPYEKREVGKNEVPFAFVPDGVAVTKHDVNSLFIYNTISNSVMKMLDNIA
ncbi:MAG: hypothetical protein ACLPKT_10320 [Methylocella sp.]